MKKYNSSRTAESIQHGVSRVSAILILEVFWNVMNKQIASNRDLKVFAQKSQLSDKTEKMSLIIKRNRLSSAVVLNRELTLATSIRISTQNLRNRLHGAGLREKNVQ